MNYTNILTKDEIVALCTIVSGKAFKEFFKSNEQEFIKIKKGFRAKSLSEEVALSTAIANIDKPFISQWINKTVDKWLNEIQKNIEKLEGEGISHDNAVATTMLDSLFVNNIDLYLKLTGQDLEDEAYSKLLEKMGEIQSAREKKVKVDEQIKNIESENHRLSEEIEAVHQKMNAMKGEYEQIIKEIEEEKGSLISSLEEAKKRIDQLQTIPDTIKNENPAELALFDDTNISMLPSEDNDEIVSLCRVITDYNNQRWLIRLADLNHNGDYQIFHRDETLPPLFKNRDKIYFKDGPSSDGSYGIWNWTSWPNEKDSSKDYIRSQYNNALDVIEVIVIEDATNLDDLVEKLKAGVAYELHSHRILFACHSVYGKYVGILCEIEWLKIVNGNAAFKDECYEVPIYEFSDGDILHLENVFSFYRHAFLGLPVFLSYLKQPIEIVKDIVFSSISWPAYKARGGIRADYSAFKEFLGAVPVDDLVSQIGTKCQCSNVVAKELLNEFLNHVLRYFNGEALENQILMSALSINTELQEKMKALIRIDWEKENKSLLEEAQKKIDSLGAELEDRQKWLTEANEKLNKAKLEDQKWADVIAEKQKLAGDVEKTVAKRIQAARENVADFITEMAFVGGQPVHNSITMINSLYHFSPAVEPRDDLEPLSSWDDVISTVSIELGEAGVADQYVNGLAAFLCAAYLEKQPLLLVGPNAMQIVEAFSAAVLAQQYGVLSCEGVFGNQSINEIGKHGEDVVIINNLFTSGWINRLPEILSQKDIFYVVTHPYAEDIQVEPKSLYGFMLPLFTETFIDKRPTGEFHGGYFANGFKPSSTSNGKRKELPILSKLNLSPYTVNRINSLVSTMYHIDSTVTMDDVFLLAVFPIAFASMDADALKEILTNNQQEAGLSKELNSNLQNLIEKVV